MFKYKLSAVKKYGKKYFFACKIFLSGMDHKKEAVSNETASLKLV